jgi:hypothetical protein
MNATKRAVSRYHSRQDQQCVELACNPDVLALHDRAEEKVLFAENFSQLKQEFQTELDLPRIES